MDILKQHDPATCEPAARSNRWFENKADAEKYIRINPDARALRMRPWQCSVCRGWYVAQTN